MSDQLPLVFQVRGSEDRRQILQVLDLIRPRNGREAAISMHAIAAETGIAPRHIQAIVKFLVEELRRPIGTSTSKPFGYFWIVTEEERRSVRNHLVRRALSILEHARAYDVESIVGPIVGHIQTKLPEVKR